MEPASDLGALGGTQTPNLLIRSYFTPPNLRLKTPALKLVACPLTSTDVCWFPSWLLYFSAVLPALADWRPRSSSADRTGRGGSSAQAVYYDRP
jgi:hypothetical protein